MVLLGTIANSAFLDPHIVERLEFDFGARELVERERDADEVVFDIDIFRADVHYF